MQALSFVLIPLAMVCGSSAFAVTVSGQNSHFPVLGESAVRNSAAVGFVTPANLIGRLSPNAHWGVTLVADVRDAKVASVEASEPVEQKRSVEAIRPTLSLPPEEISSRSDVGDPATSFAQRTNGSTPAASGTPLRKSYTSDALVDRAMPPVVEHEGAVSLANEATMMTPGDSTGPVLQTKLASLDQGYMSVTPTPIVVPDAPLTPSIVRRKPEERVAPSPKALSVHKLSAVKSDRVASAPALSQPSARPHVARLKMIRPVFDASTTSVSETAQIAGLRAMERMQ